MLHSIQLMINAIVSTIRFCVIPKRPNRFFLKLKTLSIYFSIEFIVCFRNIIYIFKSEMHEIVFVISEILTIILNKFCIQLNILLFALFRTILLMCDTYTHYIDMNTNSISLYIDKSGDNQSSINIYLRLWMRTGVYVGCQCVQCACLSKHVYGRKYP